MTLLAVELDEEICSIAADAQDAADRGDAQDAAALDKRVRELLCFALSHRRRSSQRMLAAGRLSARGCTIRTVRADTIGEAFELLGDL